MVELDQVMEKLQRLQVLLNLHEFLAVRRGVRSREEK